MSAASAKAYLARLTAAGLCVRCGKVPVWRSGSRHCLSCRDKVNAAQRRRNQRNPEAHAEQERKRKRRILYKLTDKQYLALLTQQGGGCAICGLPCESGRELAIDHDHVTGKVRGLLCLSHNVALGHFKDNPEHLRAAAAYLEGAVSGNHW